MSVTKPAFSTAAMSSSEYSLLAAGTTNAKSNGGVGAGGGAASKILAPFTIEYTAMVAGGGTYVGGGTTCS